MEEIKYKNINKNAMKDNNYTGGKDFIINQINHSFSDIRFEQRDGKDYIMLAKLYNPQIIKKYLLTTKTKKMSKAQFNKWIENIIKQCTIITPEDKQEDLIPFVIRTVASNNINPVTRAVIIIGEVGVKAQEQFNVNVNII